MTSLSASFLPSVKFRSRSRSMSWWSASYPYYRDIPMLAYVFFLHHQQIGLQVLLPPSHPAAAVPAVARPCVTTSGGTVGARTHTQRERRTLARKADFCQERDSSRVLSSPSAVDPQSSLRKRVGWGDTGCLSGRTSDARLSQAHIKSAFLWNPYLCLIHAQWCLISEFSNTVMAATRSRAVPRPGSRTRRRPSGTIRRQS